MIRTVFVCKLSKFSLISVMSIFMLLPAAVSIASTNSLNQITIKKNSAINAENRKRADLMYEIMAAELAGQQRELKKSIVHYLRAIKLSNDPRLAERAARIALYAKDNKAALHASRRWVVLEPKNAEPHRYIAILFLRVNKPEGSYKQLKKYVRLLKKKSPKDRSRFRNIVTLYAQERNTKLAFKVMTRFFRDYRRNADAMYAWAHYAVRMKRYKIASRAVNRVLRMKPKWAQASLLYARIKIGQGHKKAALRGMYRAVKAYPRSRKLRISYARLLTETRQYKKARYQFGILLRSKSKDPKILYALALLTLKSKQYNEAESFLKKMIKTGSRQLEGYYYLGLIAEQRKRFDAAIGWLSKIRRGKRAVDAHLRIASIMSKKGDVEAARRFLFQLKPRTKRLEVRLYLSEAEILQRAKRYKVALEVVSNALTANPGHADLLYARAMMAEKVNRLDIVERDLKAILKKHPKHTQALNALGYTLADRTRRFKEAHGYIKRALLLAPNEAAIIDSLGWVYYRMGNYKRAIKHLRQAFTLNKNAEIAAHLGEVLWVSGSRKAARRTWNKARRLDKTNHVLRKTLKRFRQR